MKLKKFDLTRTLLLQRGEDTETDRLKADGTLLRNGQDSNARAGCVHENVCGGGFGRRFCGTTNRTSPQVVSGSFWRRKALGSSIYFFFVSKYLWNIYYISGTILGAGNKIIDKTSRDKSLSLLPSLVLSCHSHTRTHTRGHYWGFYPHGGVIGLYAPSGPAIFFHFSTINMNFSINIK